MTNDRDPTQPPASDAPAHESGRLAPEVSVVVPTYNRARLVGRAIDSALAQTGCRFEVIVVDDGSTDDTEGVVRRYGDRVRYERQENRGAAAARNRGVELAAAPLVALLDSDDTWRPGKLAAQVAAMQDEDVVLCFTNRTWTGRPEQDRFTELGLTFPEDPCVLDDPAAIVSHPGGSPLLTSCYMVRRDALEAVGGYSEDIPVYEDLQLEFRLALLGKKFAALSSVLTVIDDCQDFAHISSDNWSWFAASHAAGVQVWTDALRCAGSQSRAVRRSLRAGLAFYHSRRAEYFALTGDAAGCRRHSLAALARRPRPLLLARAVLGLVAPRLVARRSRWFGSVGT